MNYVKPEVVTSYFMSTLMGEAVGFLSGSACPPGSGHGDDSAGCDFGGPKSIFPDGDY